MIQTGYGDNARFFTFRQDNARLRESLDRLGSELSSGRKLDLPVALGVDMSNFSSISRNLRLNESFLMGLGNAATTASARQNTLDRLSAELDGFGAGLLSVVGTRQTSTLQQRLSDAPERFAAAVNAMNASIGDRFLFSGDTPDTPALEEPEIILDELRAIVNAAPDVATAIADLDAWFQTPGGGYDTVAAIGSETGGGDVYLGEDERLDAGVTVYDAGVRTALSGLAMAALVAEGIVPGVSDDARFEMASAAANRMLQGESDLVSTRSRLGAAEGRIEAARVRAEATRTTLELEETRLTSADPYTTATEIEAVSLKLESLFLLTSRLSSLSLANYLR
jgi:flagellar hook-associated protein 3 FlgL